MKKIIKFWFSQFFDNVKIIEIKQKNIKIHYYDIIINDAVKITLYMHSMVYTFELIKEDYLVSSELVNITCSMNFIKELKVLEDEGLVQYVK